MLLHFWTLLGNFNRNISETNTVFFFVFSYSSTRQSCMHNVSNICDIVYLLFIYLKTDPQDKSKPNL